MENELSSHGRKGALIEVPDPLYEPSGKGQFVARGVAAMNNGIVIVYRRNFRIRKPLLRREIITDESRSYSAVLQGEGIIIRFDSGQVTHNPDPHLHSQITELKDLEPPTMPLASPIELGNFIERIDEWRHDNLQFLPDSPGSLEDVRLP